jgi:uncharacterized phage-associated protein
VLKFTFNAKKAAQASAVLLKLNGGDMDQYLFIKMLYLADRESMGRWGEPLTGDSATSMEYGPVLSAVYDLTKGRQPNLRQDWEPFISDADEDAHRVRLLADPDADELCQAEIQILEGIFQKFKDYTFHQIREYTHNLQEYEEVGSTSKPIAPESILKALGQTDDQIGEVQQRMKELKLAEMLLADC